MRTHAHTHTHRHTDTHTHTHTHTGFSDPYCKLKLGTQKYKSQVIHKSLNPQWRERCGLRLYDGSTTLFLEVWDKDFPKSDDFIGRYGINSFIAMAML